MTAAEEPATAGDLDDLFGARPAGLAWRSWDARHGEPGPWHGPRRDRPDGTKEVPWPPGLDGHKLADLIYVAGDELPPDGAVVVVTEGEKAADAAAETGAYAFGTVCGAASTPGPAVVALLMRYAVTIAPDADPPGREHMGRLASALEAAGLPSLRIVDPPAGAPKGWDLADVDLEERRALIQGAREILGWGSRSDVPAAQDADPLPDFLSGRPMAATDAERPWPQPRSKVDPSAALVDTWLVDGVLRPGRLLVVAGPEGLGKSRVRLELGVRLATAHGALFNHYGIPGPGRVLSFDVENGEEEEVRREEETVARLGLSRTDLADYWGVSLEGLSLTDAVDQAYIRTSIERAAPAVALFDTGSSMMGDEWGAELKAAIRFLRGLARQYGCAIVVFVHLVKPAKVAGGAKARGKPAPNAQHGTALVDVMGQWTRQADTVALMADAGAERVLWTVRKRAPHSQLVLLAEGGTFNVVQVVAGEDLGVGTAERIHGCIATGYADAGAIATYLEMSERTVFRHIATLRKAGRIAPDAPLRVSVPASAPVSARVSRSASVNGAPAAVPVSDMSAGRTDSVSPPVRGDMMSVSVDDEPEDVEAAIAAAFPWSGAATA